MNAPAEFKIGVTDQISVLLEQVISSVDLLENAATNGDVTALREGTLSVALLVVGEKLHEIDELVKKLQPQ